MLALLTALCVAAPAADPTAADRRLAEVLCEWAVASPLQEGFVAEMSQTQEDLILKTKETRRIKATGSARDWLRVDSTEGGTWAPTVVWTPGRMDLVGNTEPVALKCCGVWGRDGWSPKYTLWELWSGEWRRLTKTPYPPPMPVYLLCAPGGDPGQFAWNLVKEDKWYVYLAARTTEGMVQVALLKPTMTLRSVRMTMMSGGIIYTWDVQQLRFGLDPITEAELFSGLPKPAAPTRPGE